MLKKKKRRAITKEELVATTPKEKARAKKAADKKESAKTQGLDAFLEKEFGPAGLHEVHGHLSSGCLMWDLAMGAGFPYGHITVLQGKDGGGKTVTALMACKAAILAGGTAVFLDAEARLAKSLVVKYIGFNPEDPNFRYYYQQKDCSPLNLEYTMNLMDSVVERWVGPGPLCVVVDSIAVLRSKQQSEDMDDKRQMGLVANKWSHYITNGLIAKIRGRDIVVILINQVRQEVNFFQVGPPKDVGAAGGRALKHAASLRINVEGIPFGSDEVMKNRKFDKDYGKCIKLFVDKNTVSPPNRSGIVPYFYYPTYGCLGLDNIMSMMAYLNAKEKLNHTGSGWYEFGGHKIQGWQEMRDFIRDNDSVRKLCEELVVKTYAEQYNLL